MTPLLIAVPAALLGFLEARVLPAGLLVELMVGIGWGLVWALLARLVTRRLRRTPGRARAVAVGAALASTMLLAPGVILHLMFGSPAAYLAVQQSAAAAGTVAYYATLNPLMEWVLVPLVLYLWWPEGTRRRLVLIAAVLYYAERAATYLYFAPALLGWPERATTPALLDSVALWLWLDWLRVAVDAVALIVFAAAGVAARSSALPAADSRRGQGVTQRPAGANAS